MVKTAVLVSGGGTNLQALIDAEKRGELGAAQLCLCIASNAEAYALTRAKSHGMKTAVLQKRDYQSTDGYAAALLQALRENDIALVVLAGFLTILPDAVIRAYPNRILNIHPSLIPAFCGPGFYGLRVHEAALACGVKVTGATVHLVSEVVDGGKILLQQAVEVQDNDTPEALQRRVMEQAEWKLLPRAVKLLAQQTKEEEAP